MLKSYLDWFRPPSFPDDEDRTRQALLLNIVLITFIVAFRILFIGTTFSGGVPRLARVQIIILIAWSLFMGARFIMHAGRVAFAGAITTAVLFGAATSAIYNIGTVRAPTALLFLVTVVLSGLTISRRAILWVAGVSILTFTALLLAEINGFLPEPNLAITPTQGVTFSVAIVITAVLLYLAVKSIDEGFANARQELAERQHAEQERETYIEELNRQNAELERFTYTVSHDLRSPLVTIRGFLGALQEDLRDGRQDRLQNDFKRITEAAEKMEELLSDLLELSRIGRVANPPVEVESIRLVRDAIDNVEARIRSKNVTVHVAPDMPNIYGDRIRLREVFENLIDNAVKYMGGQNSPVIEIGARKVGGQTTFFVKDNGIGIEARYHSKIFGLFEKLNSSIEGTGVGLALVKRIVETHGGKIWVESEGNGSGSTFYFTIPDNR